MTKRSPDALGECPVFCDVTDDPCGEDSKVCKDCDVCEGEATAFLLASLHMTIMLHYVYFANEQ